MRRHRLQRRQHPIFSPIAMVSTFILVIGLGIGIYLTGGRAFSPGELSAVNNRGVTIEGFSSHADFGDDCAQCHAPFQGIEAARCERCHTNVRQERESGSGLHAGLEAAEACALCHTEHRGANASLTAVSLTNFDHTATGFNLSQHQQEYTGDPFTCTSCHVSGSGYAISANVCADCHGANAPDFMVEHVNNFGGDCLRCHDGSGELVNFDHTLVWPLEGAHLRVECSACHADRLFAGTPRECVLCHSEPEVHEGLFGINCAACHSAEAWQPARLKQHTFPLDHGEVGELPCAACHTATYTEYTCTNCHEHDPVEMERKHEKENIPAAELPNCASCHPTGREKEAARDALLPVTFSTLLSL